MLQPALAARSLAMVLLVAATIPAKSDSAHALQTIRAVGPEGQGHAEASAAWKEVVSSQGGGLIPILEAMDGANDYSLNWLRSAFDTVASRELQKGDQLPVAELGRFLLDTRHHPRGRRLVFEMLTRLDPITTGKLLPGMVNDPSMDIRRDAIEKLIQQAADTQKSGNTSGATMLFQQALGNARDPKQIEVIAKNLKDLKHPVDLLKHFGFISEWKIIGPFDNAGRKGFDTVFPPEEKIDFAAKHSGKNGVVRWQDYVTRDQNGIVDMNQPYGSLKEVTAYAATDFVSPEPRAAELRLGGRNSWKVWLNGKLLFGRDEYHTSSEIDQYVMPAQLLAGHNLILVKVCQNEEVEEWTTRWEFQLRVTDSLGVPVISAKTDAR